MTNDKPLVPIKKEILESLDEVLRKLLVTFKDKNDITKMHSEEYKDFIGQEVKVHMIGENAYSFGILDKESEREIYLRDFRRNWNDEHKKWIIKSSYCAIQKDNILQLMKNDK